MSSRAFSELFAEAETERKRQTVILHAKLVNGQLQFEPSPKLAVHANELLLGHQRIIVEVS